MTEIIKLKMLEGYMCVCVYYLKLHIYSFVCLSRYSQEEGRAGIIIFTFHLQNLRSKRLRDCLRSQTRVTPHLLIARPASCVILFHLLHSIADSQIIYVKISRKTAQYLNAVSNFSSQQRNCAFNLNKLDIFFFFFFIVVDFVIH